MAVVLRFLGICVCVCERERGKGYHGCMKACISIST